MVKFGLTHDKIAADNAYDEKHGAPAAGITRKKILDQIDKNAIAGQTRNNPEKRPVICAINGKPFLQVHGAGNTLRLRAEIPFDYATELLKTHPLVSKSGKAGTWYTIGVDDTFKNISDVMAIVEKAKSLKA